MLYKFATNYLCLLTNQSWMYSLSVGLPFLRHCVPGLLSWAGAASCMLPLLHRRMGRGVAVTSHRLSVSNHVRILSAPGNTLTGSQRTRFWPHSHRQSLRLLDLTLFVFDTNWIEAVDEIVNQGSKTAGRGLIPARLRGFSLSHNV